MEIKELRTNEDLKAWRAFVDSRVVSVWQLEEFGRFQSGVESRGERWIFGVYENGKLVNGVQVVKMKVRKEFWMYGGRGPVNEVFAKELMDFCVEFAKGLGAIFMRFDPGFEVDWKRGREIEEGFQPQCSLLLDLKKSEEVLLKEMKQKGRYNIRLAEKKGVKVKKVGKNELAKYLKEYEKLLKETTVRDGFRGHEIGYYERMLEVLGEKATLYVAEFEGEVLAAAVCTYGGKVATYYYGVSGNRRRNLMAPYLLQWKMIKDSKGAGYEVYDFLGIAPEGAKNHSWAGVTSFKKKFGGEVVSYPKPRDVVLKWGWYWMMRLKRFIAKVR